LLWALMLSPRSLVRALGLCAGFTLCYICLSFLTPGRGDSISATANPPAGEDHHHIARDGSLYLAGERLDLTSSPPASKSLVNSSQSPFAPTAEPITSPLEVRDACQAAAVSQISVATATGSEMVSDLRPGRPNFPGPPLDAATAPPLHSTPLARPVEPRVGIAAHNQYLDLSQDKKPSDIVSVLIGLFAPVFTAQKL